MTSHRLAPALILLLTLPSALSSQEPETVRVANFPDVQRITGRVEIDEPAPNTVLVSISQSVVASVSPGETERLVLGGTLEARGFRSVVFSVAGQVKSNYPGDGVVGALLVPNTPFFVRAFEEDNEALLAIRVEATVTASPSAYFAESQPRLDLAFPSYRVYFFNTTAQPVSAALYAHLAN